MHSQQHGVVDDCLVPGGHSIAQTDRGMLKLSMLTFQITLDSSTSWGLAFFVQEPTKTFLYLFDVKEIAVKTNVKKLKHT